MVHNLKTDRLKLLKNISESYGLFPICHDIKRCKTSRILCMSFFEHCQVTDNKTITIFLPAVEVSGIRIRIHGGVFCLFITHLNHFDIGFKRNIYTVFKNTSFPLNLHCNNALTDVGLRFRSWICEGET